MKIRRFIAVVVISALLFPGTTAFAKNNCAGSKEESKSADGFITEKIIRNLEMGIKSNNAGLKASAIYYAGFYEIEELSGALTKELSNSSNDLKTKILISLALYKIGGNALLKGFTAVL